jgi:membrane associated rhomboid family serine protease
VIPLRDDNPTHRTPWVTILLLVANVAVFFLLQPQGQVVIGQLGMDDIDSAATRFTFEWAAIPCEVTTGDALSPTEIRETLAGDPTACEGADGDPLFGDKGVWLAVLFSMFFHGSIVHLGGNMLFLWIFGNNIEDHLGPVRYLLFYLAAGVVATLAHIGIQPDSTIPLVGASGAVAGVMGAYLVWFPNKRVLTLFILIIPFFRHISAKWLLGFWFLSQFFVNPNAGVAWMAHVGGFVFGVAIAIVVRVSRAARKAAWRDTYRDEHLSGFRQH